LCHIRDATQHRHCHKNHHTHSELNKTYFRPSSKVIIFLFPSTGLDSPLIVVFVCVYPCLCEWLFKGFTAPLPCLEGKTNNNFMLSKQMDFYQNGAAVWLHPSWSMCSAAVVAN
jgi:hypothetical protein